MLVLNRQLIVVHCQRRGRMSLLDCIARVLELVFNPLRVKDVPAQVRALRGDADNGTEYRAI